MNIKQKCCICDNDSSKEVPLANKIYNICDEHLLLFDIVVFNTIMQIRAERQNNYVGSDDIARCDICDRSHKNESNLILLRFKNSDFLLCETCARVFYKLLDINLKNTSLILALTKENI